MSISGFVNGATLGLTCLELGECWALASPPREVRTYLKDARTLPFIPDGALPDPIARAVAETGLAFQDLAAENFYGAADIAMATGRRSRRAAKRRFEQRSRRLHRDWMPRTRVQSVRNLADGMLIEIEVLHGRDQGARLFRHATRAEVDWILESNKADLLEGCEVRIGLDARGPGMPVFTNGIYSMVRLRGRLTPQRV